MARKNKGKPAKARPIFVLNGPNLNLLGRREPEVYGRTTLAEIKAAVTARARTHGYTLSFHQTNHEGELVDQLQEAREKSCGVILNAGGYSHTSIALLDAARALEQPLIEVHLSNPYARELYRRHSYISEAADGVICGLGAQGYSVAVDALAAMLKNGDA
ncbi:MAG TPA: type II 3-dehydroquinate dehydratase [Rhizomicrobium sp.]|nr:type II 3-dehydroquinate dehydratase [Rhizomicrobium sp.]